MYKPKLWQIILSKFYIFIYRCIRVLCWFVTALTFDHFKPEWSKEFLKCIIRLHMTQQEINKIDTKNM